MKKITALVVFSAILVSSCVSKKQYAELEMNHTKTKDELLKVETTLQKCLIEKEKQVTQVASLTNQVEYLKEDKKNALKQVENLTVLSKSSS